ncbi:SACOL1771 family peroxiredoxin [Lactococcus petauri]|uniref:SACOL1771 family peroxiredoxin n=1 Tax=Lactococcus petauri TaxID=1940789 RepID=UPI0028925AD5|nr:SACOL1771 family peroxiredoxin [Lactococcus petauri]MDT2575441.1 SACOL1771 family peroxiredoxin [Lactococcus petauri]MDT2594681.1 SACOL1771 family peroxiredoxin [Lactococcus petauri]
MAKHIFTSQINWPGGRNAIGKLETGALQEKISIPSVMDGPGVGTNPDEMLLGAASTCYTITLAALLERNEITVLDFNVESEATVSVEKGVFAYEKIVHDLYLKIDEKADYDKTYRLAQYAETSCMISRAVQGNVAIEANIHLEKEKAS